MTSLSLPYSSLRNFVAAQHLFFLVKHLMWRACKDLKPDLLHFYLLQRLQKNMRNYLQFRRPRDWSISDIALVDSCIAVDWDEPIFPTSLFTRLVIISCFSCVTKRHALEPRNTEWVNFCIKLIRFFESSTLLSTFVPIGDGMSDTPIDKLSKSTSTFISSLSIDEPSLGWVKSLSQGAFMARLPKPRNSALGSRLG